MHRADSPPFAREQGLVEDGAVRAEERDSARVAALVQADVIRLATHVGVGIISYRKENCDSF